MLRYFIWQKNCHFHDNVFHWNLKNYNLMFKDFTLYFWFYPYYFFFFFYHLHTLLDLSAYHTKNTVLLDKFIWKKKSFGLHFQDILSIIILSCMCKDQKCLKTWWQQKVFSLLCKKKRGEFHTSYLLRKVCFYATRLLKMAAFTLQTEIFRPYLYIFTSV